MSAAKRRILFLIILALECALLAHTFLLRNIEYSVSFSADDLAIDRGAGVYEKGSYVDLSYDGEKTIVTPAFHVPAGIYGITVDYDSNGGIYTTECYSAIAAAGGDGVKGARLVLEAGAPIRGTSHSTTYRGYVNAPCDIRIATGVSLTAPRDSYVLVRGVTATYLRRRTMVYHLTKLLFFITLLNLAAAAGLLYPEKAAPLLKKHAFVLTGLSGIIFLACYPLLKRDIYFGDDIMYHLSRIAYLAEGLVSHPLSLRMHPGWANGYGYAAGIGYPDLFLLPSAALVALGYPISTAYEFYQVMVTILTACISFFTFARISRDKRIGMAGAVFYTLAGFRLHSIYTGATVGEYGAYTFLPLVALGLWEIYHADSASASAVSAQSESGASPAAGSAPEAVCTAAGSSRAWITLALGITGVMSMHVLSTLLLALLIPLLCIVLCRKTFTKPVFFPLLKALVLTIALNLHFMVPVLDYLLHQPMKGTGEGYPLWNNATDVVELFINAADPEHISGGWAGAGIVSFCVLMLALFLLLRGQVGIFRKEIRFLSVAAVLLLFISTKAFPYYAIRENLPFLYRIIFNIQFPWHFLNPALAVLALLFVLVLCAVKENRGENAMQAALVILCLICCAQSWLFLNNVAENGRTIAMYDAASLPSGNGDEFMIPDASLSLPYTATSVAISDPGAGHADQVTRRGLSVSARLTNDSDREVYALFPLWAYRYMTAVDESGTSLNVSEADDHRLAVLMPAGFDGTVTASFREPLHWRAAQILSLAALIWVALRLAASRRRGLSAAD